MRISLKTLAFCATTSALLFIPAKTWAVAGKVTAHSSFSRAAVSGRPASTQTKTAAGAVGTQLTSRLPSTVQFREVSGRGLLVRAWVNDAGPFTFAIDTGAGATIISRRVAAEARVSIRGGRSILIGGASGSGSAPVQEASVRSLALGSLANVLPSSGPVVVADSLAQGVDGVLDPAEAYWPLGFEIDMPRGELTAFDPRLTPLRRNQNPDVDETIVPWLLDGQSRRPFVQLEGRLRALIDTGSGFGLALPQDAARILGVVPRAGREHADVRDLGGGSIDASRVSPTNVRIGSLVLRGVPTDLLPNARPGTPILLGRDLLRPFRLTFDPVNRLIRIVPG